MEDQVRNMTFIPPEDSMQFLVNVDWKTHEPCEEYPVWVKSFDQLCPDGKRGYLVIDPNFMYSNGIDWLLCECHGRIIE